MKAVIMAGGEGTRLRPLTCSKPKPMVTIANKPVMEHIIELLSKHKITDIAVTLQYMPQSIKDYFGDGKEKKVNLKYYIEEEPLGTAGSVKNAEEFLDETFIVISGDALTDIDLNKAIEFHKQKGAIATLVLKKVDIPLDYGVVVTDDEGRIIRFLEKPSWSEVFSDTVNTGIYILSPDIFNYYQKGISFDFSRDLFPELLKDGKPMYGFISENYWCDIGDLKAYNQANLDAISGKVMVDIPYTNVGEGLWIGNNVKISDKAKILPPVIIGDNCIISENVSIGPNCVLGDYCVVEPYSSIKKSVILRSSCISKNCEIRGATICDRVNIHEGVRVYENAVIGDLTVINKSACIKPEVKIWPEKLVEEEAEINTNIVWGSKGRRNLFGNRGINGEFNIDITPEFVSRVASAYGACIKPGMKVGIACDGSIASQIIKNSMTSGILSVGIGVVDLDVSILPELRHFIKRRKLEGGIYISTVSKEDSKMNILFVESKGLDISKGMERKIETFYIREDYRRSNLDEIGRFEYENPEKELYIDELLKILGNKKIGAKIAYYTPINTKDNLIESVLKKTGCKGEQLILESDNLKECDILDKLKNLVISKRMDIGVLFDKSFEKIILIDKNKKEHREENLRLLITSALFASKKVNSLVVPYNSTQIIDELASSINTKVFRTKTSSQELMRTIIEQKDESSELQLLLNFDAIFTVCFLLLTVKNLGMSFDEFAEGLPAINMKKSEVFCPWNEKGKVIRELIHDKDALKECVEGIMITPKNGRILILPDAERPVCNIISEATTAEFANELSIIYQEKVRKIGKN